MDSTIELTDDSTFVLDKSTTPQRKKTKGGDKLGDTIDLESSAEITNDGGEQRTELTQHEAFVTASTTQILDTPRVTSTPNDSMATPSRNGQGDGKSRK